MIICKIADMPLKVRSFVRENDVDDYTVVINARLSRETQLRVLRHEVHHLEHDDIDQEETADRLEMYAHKVAE